MNKSKFLKKSLAMLLALMLVVAMIPLSASAATTDYVEDLFVNGKRAAAEGNDFTVTVPAETEEVDITAAVLNGATLYVEDDDNDIEIPELGLELADYATAEENVYTMNILAKVKLDPENDDYKTVATYTLTVTVDPTVEDDNNTKLRGLAEGVPAWNNMAYYTVEDEQEGAGLVTITMEFGYDIPEYDEGDFKAMSDDEDTKLEVKDVNADGIKDVIVKAAQGSTRVYNVVFVWLPAFESFTIPGQIGETEFVYNGRTGNKININVDYRYDLENVIPTFTLANGVDNLNIKDHANNNPPVVSGYTVLEEVSLDRTKDSKWDNVATEEFNVNHYDGSNWGEITLTITAVAKNPEGVLNTIQVTDADNDSNKSNVTETTTGTTYVELPKGTTIKGNVFDLTLNASVNATVTVVTADKQEYPANNEGDGKFTVKNVTAVADGVSFTVRVVSEDGTQKNDYHIVLQVPEKPQAKLTNIVLKDEATGDIYEAEWSGNNATITVPYSWTNPANTTKVKVYMTASTGAQIVYGDKPTGDSVWGNNSKNGDSFNELAGVDGSSKKKWMPDVSLSETPNVVDGYKTEVATYTVVSNENPEKNYNTYTLQIRTEEPKTQREISDIQMVGTKFPYAITESNTYPTEIGTATLDGKTVRTIEVTVPYSFEDDGDNSGWFKYMTISDGAVAYYYDLDQSGTTGDIETLREISTDPEPNGFVLSRYLNGKNEKGELVKGDDDGKVDYLPIYVLSEAYAVPAGATINPANYDDNDNASIYYLVVKKAAPETGDDLLSIESTLDENVTASLKGNTITISVPQSYGTDDTFSLNFEVSKLAKVYATNNKGVYSNELTSDLGSALTDATKFKVATSDDELYALYDNSQVQITADGKGKIYVVAEDKNNTQAYDVKLVVRAAETGAEITSLTVNDTAATIARDQITARLPMGTQLYPVTLDIEASKMATVYVGDKEYDPDQPETRYDVNRPVTIKVVSEDKKTVNTYTLNATVEEGFEDVNTGDWFYGEVMTAANAGWVNGMEPGKFEPNGTMTRAQFATIVARILGCDTDATVESMFPDCNETDWFNAAVTFCVKRGIIAGDDKGYFNPDEPITREQMAKILCEAAGVEQVTDPENTYADDASIAGWAKGYVYGCQAAGIMHGDESANVFDAKDSATRAEGAAVLVRAFA